MQFRLSDSFKIRSLKFEPIELCDLSKTIFKGTIAKKDLAPNHVKTTQTEQFKERS